ncbi:MAG: DNA primase [Deltaproteobacteria bacterium]|nr:DNA primase [Deltaproteobacteria bacterium]
MIGDDKVAEVRERTDIVQLIGEYVVLKRAGASFKGLCPFHSEKSPSFHVNPQRQFFHCFGCQASGDVFKFVMQLEGRSFPEALRQLADRAGVELPQMEARESDAVRREKAKRERLTAITESAAGFFLEMLAKHPHAHLARAEIAKRAMKDDTIATYRLGYAPHGWDTLAKHLGSRGFSLAECEEAGLVVPRKAGDGHYDRFRHRLMFPIADVHGKIVAFSGRSLDLPAGEKLTGDPPAKYVNSPEGPLYKKSELLFGLHEARVELRREGVAILCEGNFDVLAVHQAGLKHVVAPLGTAFTLAQAKLMKRYVAKVVVLFDGDSAGKKATRAAAPLLREAGLLGVVVALPAGEDPDSFLRTRGADALKQLVATAPTMLDHLIDGGASEAGSDPAARAQAIEALGPVLATVDNPVEIGLYIERVAQAFQINDLQSVRQQLRRGVMAARGAARPRRDPGGDARGHAGPPAPPPPEQPAPGTPRIPPAKDLSQIPGVERDLVGCLLDQPHAFDAATAEKIPELLTSREMEAIFRAALRQASVHGTVVASSLLEDLEKDGLTHGPARRWLEERLALQTFDAASAQSFLETAMPLLRKQQIEREQRELMRRIQEALREGNQELAAELMTLRDALFRAGGALQRGRR